MEQWKCNLAYWRGITKETTSIILSQSEAVLKETIETSKTISAKADRLLSIVLPSVTGLIIFIINDFSNHKLRLINLSAILCLLILILSLTFIYLNIKSYDIAVPGEYPKQMLRPEFINETIKVEEQHLNIFLHICENIQNKIDGNRLKNAKRRKNNQIALNLLLSIPISPVISYLLLALSHYLHCVFL